MAAQRTTFLGCLIAFIILMSYNLFYSSFIHPSDRTNNTASITINEATAIEHIPITKSHSKIWEITHLHTHNTHCKTSQNKTTNITAAQPQFRNGNDENESIFTIVQSSMYRRAKLFHYSHIKPSKMHTHFGHSSSYTLSPISRIIFATDIAICEIGHCMYELD